MIFNGFFLKFWEGEIGYNVKQFFLKILFLSGKILFLLSSHEKKAPDLITCFKLDKQPFPSVQKQRNCFILTKGHDHFVSLE